MMKKLVLAVLMMLFVTANAYATRNDVYVRTEVPPIIKGQCSQAGALSLTFDNNTLVTSVAELNATQVNARLTPGVNLCKPINMYVRIPGGQTFPETAPKGTGVMQGAFTSAAVAPATDVVLLVKGDVGSNLITIQPVSGTLTSLGSGAGQTATGMKLLLFNAKAAPAGELLDADKVRFNTNTGRFVRISDNSVLTGAALNAANLQIPAVRNSLCVQTPADYVDHYVEISLESAPKVYTYLVARNTIAIVDTFSISVVPAKLDLTTTLKSHQGQGGGDSVTDCDRSYESGYSFCKGYDSGLAGHFALQTGKEFEAGTYSLTLEILVNGASGDNGAYFGTLPKGLQLTSSAGDLIKPFQQSGSYAVTGKYVGSGQSTTSNPTTGCTRTDAQKIVKITGAAEVSTADVLGKKFVRINVPTISIPGVKVGDAVELRATLTQGACRVIWSGKRTLFTVVSDCAVAPADGKITFPYFAGTSGKYWNGIALVNPTNAPVEAVLNIVEQGGKKGTLTLTVPAQGMVVELVENLPKKPGFVGPAGMGAARCYIEVGGAGAGGLKGFAMMGNGLEAMGYIVEAPIKVTCPDNR